jgi:hypothetical protein
MEQLSLLEQSRIEVPEVTDDRLHVQRLADRLLRELDAEPPIDLGMVASYQGVAAVRQCELPNGGCLVTDPATGAVEIRLRSSDHPRRQRFSGFHEVTHTFMPGYRLQVQWRCDPHHASPAKPHVEVLCDVGASELILPRRMVVADLAGADFGLQTVFDLADLYDSSLHATAHRVVDLWPEDVLFVVAQVGHKPKDASDPFAEPKLRVASSWGSGSWPFIRKYKSIAEGDPLARALQGELVDEIAVLSGISAEAVGGVHVSARLCPFTDAQGVRHDRVLALYRRASVRNP